MGSYYLCKEVSPRDNLIISIDTLNNQKRLHSNNIINVHIDALWLFFSMNATNDLCAGSFGTLEKQILGLYLFSTR